MITKKIFTFFILFAFFFYAPYVAFAHVLKTSGSIGVVMHINPEDEPVARRESTLFFELKDKSNSFRPDTCDCNVEIREKGDIIYSQPLFQNATTANPLEASAKYTFPQKDVYTIILNGRPLHSGDFKPFSVQFAVRVERTTGSDEIAPSLWSNWWVQHAPHMLIIIIIVGYLLKAGIKERKTKLPGDEENERG